MKCEKIEIKKLAQSKIGGNYLFSDEQNHYFYDFMRNSMFLRDGARVYNIANISQNIDNVDCYYNYLTDVINICKASQNQPSVLYVGESFESEKLVDIVESELNVNDEPVYVRLKDVSKFDALFEKIIISRTTEQFEIYRPLFIFVDDFSKININNLVRFVTVSRSRFVYFVLLVEDDREFDELDFEPISANCPLKFMYNETGDVKVLDRYENVLDKNKKEFVEK